MTTFWLIAAALIVLALALVLPALIRSGKNEPVVDRKQQNILIAREKLNDLETEFQRGSLGQQDYEQIKSELEQGLFDDVNESTFTNKEMKKPAWVTAALVTLVVPVATVLIYRQIGDPRAINPESMQATGAVNMKAMVAELEGRLAKDPGDTDGWLMLGRTYMAEENYAKAEDTYSKLLKEEPDNADFMLLRADAMAMNAGGKISGEPERLILAALEKDPENSTGLWLAGMAAREKGDKQTALTHWKKLQGLLPAGSEDLASLNQLVAQLNGEPAIPPGQQVPDIASMVKQLEDKLKAEPQNPTGWLMLGRSYMIMKRFEDAVTALEEAVKQNPEEPQALLTLADASAMNNNGRMSGRPAELVSKVLTMTPDNPKALWLGGMSAREMGDNATAVGYWQKLLPQITNDPGSTEEVKNMIRQAGGTVAESAVSAEVTKPADTTAISSLQATINLPEEIAAMVKPDDTVFIYVKAFRGPPMPLAAARKQVRDLPIVITLDDTMGMMPEMKMSDHEQLIVGARISKTGQPIAASGDIFAEQGPVKSGDMVVLTINQIVK